MHFQPDTAVKKGGLSAFPDITALSHLGNDASKILGIRREQEFFAHKSEDTESLTRD